MAKKPVEIPVKTTKVKIKFQDLSATIIRDNLPTILDASENAVKWLAKNYKPEEIEIVGNKPAYWDTYFPPSKEPIPV